MEELESAPVETSSSRKKKLISVVFSVIVTCVLAILVLLGLISLPVALLVFGVFIVGMVVFHGGASSMVSGLSDAEGYERELEEEEQRKALEAEEAGETRTEETD